MGPQNKNDDYDIIWVDVDKTHYLIPREENWREKWKDINKRDQWFKFLSDISRGDSLSLISSNAAGFKEIKNDINQYVDKTNEHYYSFLESLNNKK